MQFLRSHQRNEIDYHKFPRHKTTCTINVTFEKKQDEGLHDL
jgi:hypothetical protein